MPSSELRQAGLQSVPVQPVIKLIDESFNKDSLTGCHLSLLIGHKRFAYSLLHVAKNSYVALEEFEIRQQQDFAHQAKNIKTAIEDSDMLHADFRSVSAAIVTDKSTLIPAPLFDQTNQDDYLHFNHEMDEGEHIATDFLREANVNNIYHLPKEIETILKTIYPKIKIMHHSTALIEGLLIMNKNKEGNKVVVHIQSDHFEMVVSEDNRLVFYNSFHYKTREDIAYYLLFACEQLKLNPDKLQLFLLGNIRKGKGAYVLLEKYIRKLQFSHRPLNFDYSPCFDKTPHHYYFNLFNQYLMY